MATPRSSGTAGIALGAFGIMAILTTIALVSIFFVNPSSAAATPTPIAMPTLSPTATMPSSGLFDPSVGAPLPNDRIVTFAGVAGGSEVNGPASSLPITAPNGVSLQQLGKQYATADPHHPVKLGLDVVVNAFEDCYHNPTDFPTCTSTATPSVIQRYIDYAQQNNLLLFLNVQLGTTTVADMVTQLMPYLRYPFVELELDTAFHYPPDSTPSQIFSHDNNCGCLKPIQGHMDAGEINWTIDQLAQLVLQYRIPSKVLVFDQPAADAVINMPKIKANPYVAIVQQMDAPGAIDVKVGDYGRFVTDQLIQYGGFKLFFSYPESTCCTDTPLMAPKQVFSSLNPAPLLVSYQ
jgi:hypothetical protein